MLDPKDTAEFLSLAAGENLEATVVAEVTGDNRLKMLWRGETICDISREFLNSNGATKHISVSVKETENSAASSGGDFASRAVGLMSELNVCSKRGLAERFDSTIGAGTVLMPFGGRYQRTPAQAMAAKIPVLSGETDDCSVFAYGCNPSLAAESPYAGAYTAVVDSLSKLVAAGAKYEDAYLTFQEFFEKPRKDPERWGRPFSALLGAFDAQLDFGVAAIGGKDSMSGSFESLDVPPTFVSFAVAMSDAARVISPEFKRAGSKVCFIAPPYSSGGIPDAQSQKEIFKAVRKAVEDGKVISAYAVGRGGICEAAAKMSFGNGIGISFSSGVSCDALFAPHCGAFLLECIEDSVPGAEVIGVTADDGKISAAGESVPLETLYGAYSKTLESVYPTDTGISHPQPRTYSHKGRFHFKAGDNRRPGKGAYSGVPRHELRV